MAKAKVDHEQAILKAIKDNKLIFIEHIFGYYGGIKKTQFYNLCLNESDEIKEAIEQNKRKIVQNLAQKWADSDNPTLQIAIMRICADDDTRRKLNQQYVEQHSTSENVNIDEIKKEIREAIERNGFLE